MAILPTKRTTPATITAAFETDLKRETLARALAREVTREIDFKISASKETPHLTEEILYLKARRGRFRKKEINRRSE